MSEIRQNSAENISWVVMVQQIAPFKATFNGGPSSKFLHELERYFQQHSTPEKEKLKIALAALRGIAFQWYTCMQSSNPICNYLSFKQQFLSAFPKTFNQSQIEAEIYSLNQREGQSALDFAMEKISKCQEYLEGVTEAVILKLVRACSHRSPLRSVKGKMTLRRK